MWIWANARWNHAHAQFLITGVTRPRHGSHAWPIKDMRNSYTTTLGLDIKISNKVIRIGVSGSLVLLLLFFSLLRRSSLYSFSFPPAAFFLVSFCPDKVRTMVVFHLLSFLSSCCSWGWQHSCTMMNNYQRDMRTQTHERRIPVLRLSERNALPSYKAADLAMQPVWLWIISF